MKIGKIIKKIFTAMFVIFFAALIIRIFMLTDTRTLSDVYPTDNAATAYAAEGNGAFLTHKTSDEISSDGYFGAYAMCYSKSSGEMQITARYNDSLSERYLIGSDPDTFRWELRDKNGATVSKGRILDTAEKYRYNYVRIAFDGVKIGENTQLYLYLISDECAYPDSDNEGFAVHKPGQNFKTYKLSGDEKKALEE